MAGVGVAGLDAARDAAGDTTMKSESVWFLSREVFNSLRQIDDMLASCLALFPTAPPDSPEAASHRHSHVLQHSTAGGSSSTTAAEDTAKCVLVLSGAYIVQAELQIKIRKHPNVVHRTAVGADRPWLLTQIQDSTNLLAEARQLTLRALHVQTLVPRRPQHDHDETVLWCDAATLRLVAGRVSCLLDQVMTRLQRGRDCLLTPRKKTIEHHLTSENMKSLTPPLPGDIAVSFYVQASRLMLAVYHLVSRQGSVRFDALLMETSVTRLHDTLVCFTNAFQLCQQIKNKLYWACN